MLVTFRQIAWSYAIASLGVLLAAFSPIWLTPLLGDTPPMRLLLILVVTVASWLGGLGPGLVGTGLGLVAIVVTNDMPGNFGELTQRLVRFGLLSLLITLMMRGLRASRLRAEAKERELRLSEGRYQRLVETAGEGIWVIDDLGRTTYANPRLGEMLGVDAARLIGERLESYVVGNAESMTTMGSPAWHEVRLRDVRGEIKRALVLARWIGRDDFPGVSAFSPDDAGLGLLLMLTDVTELKRTEEALRAERDFSSAVLETAGCLVVVLDREGRIVRFNRACREATGIEEAEAIGRPLEELFRTPEEAMATRRAFEEVLGGGGPLEFESRWCTASGGFRRIAWKNTTLKNAEGCATFVIGTGTDVTELRMAEEALREAKELAEAASHAKDRFLAVLSHELRTPLTPALIAVSALLESRSSPGLRASLEMIRRNIELEARLIDDLLDLSRIARGRLSLELEVVDVHQTIRQAIEICRNDALVAGVSVISQLAAERHHVIADHARLLQIVWNLIRNAVKFTPMGGRLTIATKLRGEGGGDGNGDGASDEGLTRLVVDFTDTGIGIEPGFLPRIFNAFEQTQEEFAARSGGGLGLGLAISRSLAEAVGGRLTAMSDGPGTGTTFRLELATTVEKPLGVGIANDKSSSGAMSDEAPDRCLRIMLVEDNEDTLRFLAIILRQRGHEVVTAERVAEAHAKLAMAKTSFDLLISDIELPDGSGLHLMSDVRRERKVPGIAMSGFGSDEDVRMSREAGFAEHLTKPVDMHRLDAAIRRVSREHTPLAVSDEQADEVNSHEADRSSLVVESF